MEQKERRELYQRAITEWGIPDQVFMVFEETGEMLDKLAKYNRNRSTPQEIITELVDVWILTEQMAEVFGFEQFEKEKEYKLNRLKQRLDNRVSLKKTKKQ